MQLMVPPGVVFVLGLFFVALGVLVVIFRKPIHGWIGAVTSVALGAFAAVVAIVELL